MIEKFLKCLTNEVEGIATVAPHLSRLIKSLRLPKRDSQIGIKTEVEPDIDFITLVDDSDDEQT